jgi:hypothetical protein
MAYNLMLAAGQMGDYPLLDYGHRVPFAISDKIKTMMFAKPIQRVFQSSLAVSIFYKLLD